jgi:uncharacterized protein DUF6249
MKTLLITCICSLALAIGVFGQSPTISPTASPAGSSATPTASVTPTASEAPTASVAPPPSASATATSALAAKIHQRLDKKMKQKGVHFSVGDDDVDAMVKDSGSSHDDIPAIAIPIVAVVFFSIFGAPVLIVALLLYFGFSKNRMMHKTVRMMVEKGQEVPAALLAPPPPAVRQRSDMRRGVVLVMIGLGLVIFLGAVNDWEGGSWAIGIIPFLIGLGYLLVWKLEGKKDIPPPLP